jgi:hypothetical protein
MGKTRHRSRVYLVALSLIIFLPLAPAVTDPQCFTSQAYRDTHERECLIDTVPAGGSTGHGGSGGQQGGLLGLLHGLTGGLL